MKYGIVCTYSCHATFLNGVKDVTECLQMVGVCLRTDDRRRQTADDPVLSTCCDSPPLDDKWASDDDGKVKSSNDSRRSMAEWYQQPVVDSKHAAMSGDFRHPRTTLGLREQYTEAVDISNTHSTGVGSLALATL